MIYILYTFYILFTIYYTVYIATYRYICINRYKLINIDIFSYNDICRYTYRYLDRKIRINIYISL